MQESMSVEDVLKALKGKIYYSKEKKQKERIMGIEDIYKTTIVIAVQDLTEEKINNLQKKINVLSEEKEEIIRKNNTLELEEKNIELKQIEINYATEN